MLRIILLAWPPLGIMLYLFRTLFYSDIQALMQELSSTLIVASVSCSPSTTCLQSKNLLHRNCTFWRLLVQYHYIQVWLPLYKQPLYMAIPSVYLFFPNTPLLAKRFQQYRPKEVPNKHKNKLIWQSWFFVFRRLNKKCYILFL